jgi:protocatechuate 3,4-dioxygenase beta subunit
MEKEKHLMSRADVSGEGVRRDLTENEKGVPMTMEVQVVDVKTCLPLKDVAVDIWSCNTTVRLKGNLTKESA